MPLSSPYPKSPLRYCHHCTPVIVVQSFSSSLESVYINVYISVFFSKISGPTETNFCRNIHLMVMYNFSLSNKKSKMATTAETRCPKMFMQFIFQLILMIFFIMFLIKFSFVVWLIQFSRYLIYIGGQNLTKIKKFTVWF